jgi:two-component sensor histidine kinase/CheY-like chemotaxis protein
VNTPDDPDKGPTGPATTDTVDDDDTIVLGGDGEDVVVFGSKATANDEGVVPGEAAPSWTVLVVDDEPDVHTVTRLALAGFRFEGSPIRLIEARSAAQARAALEAESACTVVLLDVVMESDDAGLKLARWIRESLKNPFVRIVLRTGQPGAAPEEAVMADYDIHDYYAKTEISARRLRTTVTSGIRAWRDVHTLHLQQEALQRAQDTIVRSLKEKETLLKEIHHRVKNNLQIVSSLLRLQSEKMPWKEARDLIEESVLRVQSMALIHQHLYGVDSLDRVDLGDYARVLSESLRSLLAPSVRLQIDAMSATVALHEAIPTGLILNELLTNAFKYGVPKAGFPAAHTDGGRAGPGCDVRIEIGRTNGLVRLAVIDSGPGLPAEISPEKGSSIGLHLIRLLTRQLRGTLRYEGDRGSCFVVTFAPVELGEGTSLERSPG